MDDDALLEFSAPKTLYLDISEENFQALSKYSRGPDPYLRPGQTQEVPAIFLAGIGIKMKGENEVDKPEKL